MLTAKALKDSVQIQGAKQEIWEFYDYWQEILWPNWKTSGKMSEIVQGFDTGITDGKLYFVTTDKQFKDAMNKTLEYFKVKLEL